jgi:hypothetical protein
VTSAVSESRIWLRTPRFDLGLQLGALVGIAPPLLIYAAYDPGRASSLLPLVSLIAIPFLHVFGSFFFAFSSRNRSPSPPRRLAIQWAVWAAAVVALLIYAPRGLATFALLYGGWHILRQNFGFLRELAHRGGLAKDPTLRRLDLAACIAPAVALWLFITERGPWHFMGADVYHLTVPTWLLALAFATVPATALVREHRLAGSRTSAAGLLLLLGNAAALLGPALFLDDLTLIYTLSASFHGIQYLAYLGERERADNPAEHPTRVLLPLVSAIMLSMIGWFVASMLLLWVLPAAGADRALVIAWYTIVPFHYFVDGKIWRRGPAQGMRRTLPVVSRAARARWASAASARGKVAPMRTFTRPVSIHTKSSRARVKSSPRVAV